MHHLHSLIKFATVLSAIALAAGCSKPTDISAAEVSSPAATKTFSAPQPMAVSKLGELSPFRSIVADVAVIVNTGNIPAAKARIKDLEVRWDSAEAGLKPRAASDWHVLDKSIDHALSTLRADAPNQNDCNEAIADLLITFDNLQGKSRPTQ
jgi:hypothetical protein